MLKIRNIDDIGEPSATACNAGLAYDRQTELAAATMEHPSLLYQDMTIH